MGNILKSEWTHGARYLVPRFFSCLKLNFNNNIKKEITQKQIWNFSCVVQFYSIFLLCSKLFTQYHFSGAKAIFAQKRFDQISEHQIRPWGYSNIRRLEWVTNTNLAWKSLIKIWKVERCWSTVKYILS